MQDSDWVQKISQQESRLSASTTCCVNYEDIQYQDLEEGGVDAEFSIMGETLNYGGQIRPVVGVKLTEVSGKKLEFISRSDKLGGFGMRLDRILFIRPDVVFLNSDYSEIKKLKSVDLCWGRRPPYYGAWQRFDIPDGASYILLTPSIDQPVQRIDTRKLGISPLGPASQAIADANQSYHAAIRMGYEGFIHAELVSEDSGPLGRCM